MNNKATKFLDEYEKDCLPELEIMAGSKLEWTREVMALARHAVEFADNIQYPPVGTKSDVVAYEAYQKTVDQLPEVDGCHERSE